MIGPGGGVTVFPKRRYLFVDGACLELALERFHKRYFAEELEIAPEKLVIHLHGQFDKVFYYDALPIMENGETEEVWKARTAAKRSLLERLEQTDRFVVFEGDVRRKGGSRDRREQKKVDVGLAVDMLTNAFRRNMDEAFLLTGDIDFVPLLRALALEGMPVTLVHPDQTTAELKRAALLRVSLDAEKLWGLIPDKYRKRFPIPQSYSTGQTVAMPGAIALDKWVTDGSAWTVYEYIQNTVVLRSFQDGTVWHTSSPHRSSLLRYCDEVHDAQIPPDKLAALLGAT